MNELEEELQNDSPKYEFFRTEIGKKFEDQFEDLMNFATLSNFLSQIPYLYTIFSDWLNNIQKKTFEKYKGKVERNEDLSEEEQKEVKDIFTGELSKVLKSTKTNQKLKDTVSGFMERINSYFFLAYYAYLDVYVNSLFDFLKSRLEPDMYVLLQEKFDSKKYKNDQINVIKNSIILISPEDFGSILKGRTWKESFDALIDRRHFMAHEDPLARYQMLKERFKKVVKKAEKRVKEFPKQFVSKKEDIKLFSKFFDKIKINLTILFSLIEIGNDCYSYLALIDTLIVETFQDETS